MNEKQQDFLDLSGIRPPGEHTELLNDRDFPILRGLSPVNLRILNSASRVMHVSKGVEMLHEGDTPHDLYFVSQGELSIARKIDGEMKFLATLHAGDVYGEFGALRKRSRTASVITEQPGRIILVDLDAVHQVLEADPDFRKRLNELLTMRMLDTFLCIHPVFYHLPDQTRHNLADELSAVFVRRGERIFSQGDAPEGIYFILSGEVEVRYLNREGAELLLEVRRDPDLLGELARKHGKELAYSAVAASDVDLVRLDQATMRLLERRHEATFGNLKSFIDQRAEQTIRRLKDNPI